MTHTQFQASTTSAAAEGPSNLAIDIKGLKKTYKGRKGSAPKQALKGVDLAVPQGSIFGLLGPNGAGKSTLINTLAGLVIKDAGSIRLMGIDLDKNPRRARLAIGVVPQELNLDAFFTPREVLELQAGLFGVPANLRRTSEVLQAVGLADKADAYARSLSGGMRRRLLVGKALVHDPPVVILDEPTAGVDIELRRQLWQHMRELNERGVTIVLTTHYLEEAEAMCDTIAIIDHGEVVACDRTASLIAQLDEKHLTIALAQPLNQVPAPLAALGFTLTTDGELSVAYRPSEKRVGALLESVRGQNLEIVDLATQEADLEELFVRLTSSHQEAISVAQAST